MEESSSSSTANAGATAFPTLSPLDLKHPGGLLSRAGSGASTSSSGSESSAISSGATSLFDRLSCSDSSDRRSSFASSVDSARCSWAKDAQLQEEQEDGDTGSNDGSSSNNDEFYDLQTPTVEFGGNANASAAAMPATAKHAERLRGYGAGTSSSSTSAASTAVSNPSAVRANSDESAKTVKRPSTHSGGGGTPLSSEGFPWNATSNTTSHSMHKVLSTSSSLGTPSAIFSSGMEEPESGSDEESDVNSPGGASDTISAETATYDKTRRLSSSHSTGGRASSSSSAGSSTHQSMNAAGRNYERGSIDHHRPSTSSSTTRMFGYAAPTATSISSPRLPSAPSSPSLSMGGLGGVPSSSVVGQYPYPANKRVSTANSSGGRAASSSLQHNRSSPDIHSQPPSTSARPSTASSVTSNSSRPWVKDSDASSVKSTSGMSSDGSLQDESGDTPSVMSPAAPPPVPFLPTGPQPAGCRITVDASAADHFLVVATLPGFSLDNITLALKRNGSLHILADRYDDPSIGNTTATAVPSMPGRSSSSSLSISSSSISSSSSTTSDCCGGHFERMVELGDAAIGSKVQAEFDGKRLKVTIAKRLPVGHLSQSNNVPFNATSGGSGFRHPGAPAGQGMVPSSRKASIGSIGSAGKSKAAMASPSLTTSTAKNPGLTSADARFAAAAGSAGSTQARNRSPSDLKAKSTH